MYHQLHCSHVQDGYTPGACFPSLYRPGVLFSPRHLPSPSLGGVPSLFQAPQPPLAVDDLASRSREDGIPYPWVPFRWFGSSLSVSGARQRQCPPSPRHAAQGSAPSLTLRSAASPPPPGTPTPSHLPGTALSVTPLPDSSALPWLLYRRELSS